MRSQLLVASVLACCALSIVACGDDEGPTSGSVKPSLTVVATTTQMADFVREVGGDRVKVEQVLEPNADPHDYEPRPSDSVVLGEARLVFRSGGDLDEWLNEVIESAGGTAKVVQAVDSVETIEGEAHGDGHEGEEEHEEQEHTGDKEHEADPHWWQDPHNAKAAVRTIRDALVDADPKGRATYTVNARKYLGTLEVLDASVAKCIERVPPESRKLVTTHDALGYYASRYDLEVVGALIPSLSSQAQPSSKDTAGLVEQIERLKVKAIFPEGSLNPRLEEAVARESGAAVGGALWADTLGPAGSSGETYVESIQSNTETIVAGLTGGAVSCRPEA